MEDSEPSSVRPLNESRRTARGSAARTLRDEPVGYSGSGSNETLARSFIPIAFAAAGVRSITRSLNGPRSLILTQILHPLALFVTRTRRPHRKVLWAAVRAPSSSVPPHATWLPLLRPYTEATPSSAVAGHAAAIRKNVFQAARAIIIDFPVSQSVVSVLMAPYPLEGRNTDMIEWFPAPGIKCIRQLEPCSCA